MRGNVRVLFRNFFEHSMEGIKTVPLILIVAILILAVAFLLRFMPGSQPSAAITNFDDCAAAGYSIRESYPEQCATPDGRVFVNDREPQGPAAAGGCKVAGCSGQLCIEAIETDEGVTTCEFKAEYACYRSATCARQPNGRCGWTPTQELAQCLQNPPAVDGNIEIVY